MPLPTDSMRKSRTAQEALREQQWQQKQQQQQQPPETHVTLPHINSPQSNQGTLQNFTATHKGRSFLTRKP